MDIVALDPFKIAQVSSVEAAMISTNQNNTIQADIIKAYRLFKRIMAYPQMVSQMRKIFLEALEKEDKTSPEKIRQEALIILKNSGDDTPDESRIQELVDILIDFWFSNSFSSEKIENYINFARKQKQFSKLVHVINQEGVTYGKIKKELQYFCDIPEGDIFIPPCETEGARVGLVNHFISNQLPFIGIAKHYITIRDIGAIARRIIRTNRRPGKIGGKSAGMILARSILVPRLENGDPELEKHIRMPESWYINTGIFSDFIAKNQLYHLHAQKYKSREDIEKDYEHISDLFKNASFPEDVLDRFKILLEEIGEHPLVLKPSSLLEDNFDYAFSEKYNSVFLANQGNIGKRLKEFVWGLKRVHMSTYGPTPILYRKNHGLLDFDEKMSVLVQKVVGRQFGNYFFPLAAGAGFSCSSYAWTPRINKEDGVIRLVMGMGTRAVGRIGEDYPRMVHLSDPLLRPEASADKIAKYSQKFIDVLNLETGNIESKPLIEFMSQIDYPDLVFAVSEDCNISTSEDNGNSTDINHSCITFDGLLKKTSLSQLMKKVLKKLEQAYGRPVGVEFAWDGDLLYIVQCRPLSKARDVKVDIPEDIYKGLLFFKNNKVVSGGSIKNLEYIVYVNPKAYAALPAYEDKIEIGKVISRINRNMEDKPYALFGPGRWGSNDINLGVRAGLADINNASILGEVAFKANGSNLEVSYGTHFFNDLAASGILHVAFFPDENNSFFHERLLLNSFNQLSSLLPGDVAWEPVVHLIHIPSCYNGMKLQIIQDSRQQKGVGFFC